MGVSVLGVLQDKIYLGERRLTSLSEEKGLKPLSQWAFIWFSLYRSTGHIHKAHQSLSGSNDQTIDNIQRTMRAILTQGQIAKGP